MCLARTTKFLEIFLVPISGSLFLRLYLHWVRYCYGFEEMADIVLKVILIRAPKVVSH